MAKEMKLPYQILIRHKFQWQADDGGKKWVAVKRVYKGKQYVKYDHVPKDEDKYEVAERLYSEVLALYPTLPNQP